PPMRLTDLPERSLTGITVECRFDELSTHVPAAWRRLSDAHPPDGAAYAELSTELGDGRSREVLWLRGPDQTLGPARPPRTVPAGSWVTTVHDGPEHAIAETFGEMLAWAAACGLEPTGEKLDVGYRLDGTAGPHELGVRVR